VNTIVTTILSVYGMGCNKCAESVRRLILKIPGVADVSVTVSQSQAVVVHDAVVETEHFRYAVIEAGFRVE
jgi:copper chaperone CopZ